MTISALPPPPSRADSANFRTRADAFLAALPTFATEANALAAEINSLLNAAYAAGLASAAANAAAAAGSASSASASAQASTTRAADSANSATQAAAARNAAQGYATLAQATNPDSPVRLNTARITADTAIPEGYNAVSAGPIEVAEGVTVTVSDNATWSIV